MLSCYLSHTHGPLQSPLNQKEPVMSTNPIPIAITGAAGRMGQRLVALGRQDKSLQVVSAVERPDHPQLGQDVGNVVGVGPIGLILSSDIADAPRVLIEFSAPAATRHWLDVCQQRNIAMVIGTTGLQPSDHNLIDAAARRIPILQAPNMNLGVAVMYKIAAEVARTLGDDYDIEIVEGHHRFKKDAPSGTAMGLADAILNSQGKSRDRLVYDRHGDDCVRKPGDIGMHALRIGDEVGRHTAYFAGIGERLELTHVATNRDSFVLGALRAAKWLAGQKPGRYAIADVLGMR
jgi:4-hydroxy-tetrahydrodipicolinate reductase